MVMTGHHIEMSYVCLQLHLLLAIMVVNPIKFILTHSFKKKSQLLFARSRKCGDLLTLDIFLADIEPSVMVKCGAQNWQKLLLKSRNDIQILDELEMFIFLFIPGQNDIKL